MGPAPTLVQVTDTVHLAQGHAVNWTLVADDTGVMLIDAGYPGDREDVLASLRKLGYDAGDVRAILLTHAHIDHLGSAIWFANDVRHAGVLPRRRGRSRQAGVPGAGLDFRCRTAYLASPVGECGGCTWCAAAA